MPPIIWTSKMRWSDSRTRASRTAANASKRRSLELLAVLEPLPELDRLPAQLLVRELLELGLEGRDVGGLLREPLHPPALAEAKGLLEAASGARRGHQRTGYRQRSAGRSADRLERRRLDLPESPSSRSARTTYSVPSARRARSNAGARAHRRAPVDGRCVPRGSTTSSASLAARPGSRRPRSATRRRPTSRALSHRLGPVGRRDRLLDRVGERRQRPVRLVLVDDERAVGQGDEVHACHRRAQALRRSRRRPSAAPAARRGCPGSPRCSPSQPGVSPRQARRPRA